MKFKIKKMEAKSPIMKDNKVVGQMNGYAFVDHCGSCYIVVYGERQRDLMDKMLNNGK